MSVETELKQKQVRIAELEAEATKVQQIKQAEGEAQVHVLQAKGEADAMQYTLPLKEKQIQQSKLEAEARKEATIQNAEASAQAKIIDSKAETERRKLLAEAEADRIRLTAAADAERMQSEAAVLKQNPLLINKIVAEKLSDKLQIMMVPADGKFFMNDVLRNMTAANAAGQTGQAETGRSTTEIVQRAAENKVKIPTLSRKTLARQGWGTRMVDGYGGVQTVQRTGLSHAQSDL